MVSEMLSLIFSSADRRFAEKELVWRIYTTTEVLPTTRGVEIIDEKDFVAAALSEDDEAFVVLAGSATTYPCRKIQIALLDVEEVPVTVSSEYSDYVNKILVKKLDVFVTVYLDDTLIYTEDPG